MQSGLLGRQCERDLLSDALGPFPHHSPAHPGLPRGLESQLELAAGAPKCLVPPVGRKWDRSLERGPCVPLSFIWI